MHHVHSASAHQPRRKASGPPSEPGICAAAIEHRRPAAPGHREGPVRHEVCGEAIVMQIVTGVSLVGWLRNQGDAHAALEQVAEQVAAVAFESTGTVQRCDDSGQDDHMEIFRSHASAR